MTDSSTESNNGDQRPSPEFEDGNEQPTDANDGATVVANADAYPAEAGEPNTGEEPADDVSDDAPQFVEGGSKLLSNRYRIDATLGEGAMGKVFRGEHVLMEKTVAIKVLRPEMVENEEMIARFQREARAAAALDHPNVCQATDFGQRDDGSFFLVMEYLEGATLQQVVADDGHLSVDRALHIARQTASALAEAHSQGIVHRDLKPENIMLVERGGQADTVKIMDFGIARLLASSREDEDDDGATRLTREGMVYGTPHYMSPEQVAGDDVDARTDLYALGAVLFEMLTGTPPYDGDNIARVMGKHITEPIPKLSEHLSTGPSQLEQLLKQLLAKDADERPQDAAAVVEAIDGLSLDDGGSDSPNLTETFDDVVDRARSSGKKAADALGPRVETAADNLGPMAHRTAETAKVAVRELSRHARAGATTALAVTRQAATGAWKMWTGLPKMERRIAAGLAMLLMVMGMLTALAVGHVFSADRQAAAIDDHRQALMEDEEIADAVDRAAAGDRSALDELLADDDDDPHLRYLSLQADLDANRSVSLIDEAGEIMELDGRYAHEPELVERLGDKLTSSAHGDDARTLIVDHLNSSFVDDLAERARIHSSSSMRDAAYELLEETGQLQQLDDWQRVTAEMRQISQCSKLAEKLEQLRAIGDARAIPTLEQYQNRSRRGCGTLRLQDCIGCIRGDLGEVIDELSDD